MPDRPKKDLMSLAGVQSQRSGRIVLEDLKDTKEKKKCC